MDVTNQNRKISVLSDEWAKDIFVADFIDPPQEEQEERQECRCSSVLPPKRIKSPNLVCINSKSRFNSGVSEHNPIRVNLSTPLQEFEKITLYSASVPISWDLINSSCNQLTLEEELGAAIFTITISSGSYTPNLLAQEIQNKLNAPTVSPNGYTYAVTYTSLTNTMTISTSANFRIRGDLNTTSSICKNIGFMLSATSFATTQTSTWKVDIGAPQVIYLKIDEVGGAVITASPSNSGNSFILTLESNSNEMRKFTVNNDFKSYILTDLLTSTSLMGLTLSLRFEDGTLVPIKTDWSIVLELQ